jgi:small subunit ribosomal protein S3
MAGERKIVADNLKRVLLKEYMMKATERAGFGGLDIQRTPMGTRITLFTERPGIVIGRRGASIKELTTAIDQNFQLDNPQIEVEEVEYPALNAQIMAEKLASALERGWHFRRAGHSTLRRIMEAGAKGALIKISGKLTSQRHRTQKFKAGHIKYCGEPKNQFVRVGFATAKLKQGVIGVTVWITDPNAKLPDEIEVKAPVKVEEVPVEVEAEEEALVEEAAKVLKKVKKVSEQVPLGPAERKLKRLKRVVEELGEEVELGLEEAELEEPEEPEATEEEAQAEAEEKEEVPEKPAEAPEQGKAKASKGAEKSEG